jgi:hypothetical protein
MVILLGMINTYIYSMPTKLSLFTIVFVLCAYSMFYIYSNYIAEKPPVIEHKSGKPAIEVVPPGGGTRPFGEKEKYMIIEQDQLLKKLEEQEQEKRR